MFTVKIIDGETAVIEEYDGVEEADNRYMELLESREHDALGLYEDGAERKIWQKDWSAVVPGITPEGELVDLDDDDDYWDEDEFYDPAEEIEGFEIEGWEIAAFEDAIGDSAAKLEADDADPDA